MNGNSEILRLLLSSCKEKDIINTVDKKKNNALHYAIHHEKAISLMRILLDCNKTELNHKDKVCAASDALTSSALYQIQFF
jgi:hypothetical protein